MAVRHVPGWSTLGDQTGPVDIRGARPLHSGCCEAVLECASHAVDSRIFGSSTFFKNKTIKKKKRDIFLRVCKNCFYEGVRVALELPPELRWQSGRLLTDRSLVRSQVVACIFFSLRLFFSNFFFLPDPLMKLKLLGTK